MKINDIYGTIATFMFFFNFIFQIYQNIVISCPLNICKIKQNLYNINYKIFVCVSHLKIMLHFSYWQYYSHLFFLQFIIFHSLYFQSMQNCWIIFKIHTKGMIFWVIFFIFIFIIALYGHLKNIIFNFLFAHV